MALVAAIDRDPAPGVVDVELTAGATSVELTPGVASTFASYGGTLPGPLIHARRGDRLRVHLVNQLSEPTSVHFHGIRLPNSMDGVPDMTQPAVPPGGSFDYDFELPDAGLFWYHPHYDSVAELGSGLYGAILVDDPDEPADIGDEHVLVLSDATVDANGRLVPPDTAGDAVIAGSEGNVVLVNGRVHPRLAVGAGRRQRFRVLNAARARFFKLGVSGQRFLELGSDGGRFETPLEVAEPVLAPGERLDLVLAPEGPAGSTLELVSRAVSRGLPLAPSAEVPLVSLELTSATEQSPPLPELTRALVPLDMATAEPVTIGLTLDEKDGQVTMGINGVAGDMAEPIHALVGSTQELVVENETPYDHPFHLHGFFFQPLDADGVPLRPLAEKDTIDIPPLTRVRLGVRYDDRPGMWMFHCHILDHAEAGMMGMLHLME